MSTAAVVPALAQLDLSLVIPCYNEASHLRGSVARLLEVLEQTQYEWEVVFVDDGSMDETRALLREICESSPRCRYIFHERNRGRGAAFKTGFAATTGRITGFIDIDLEVDAHYVPRLVGLIDRHGVDVATGFRHYLLSQTGGLGREALSVMYRQTCRWLLGVNVRDTETGCKFFKRETAAETVLSSECDGWFWDTEVMTRSVLNHLRVAEVPVLFLRRWDKASTVRVIPDSFRYLVELGKFRDKVGLSLRQRSPIYWTATGYDLTMRALCGRQYHDLYADVARLIPNDASVVDVCCGTARLWQDFLRHRGNEYLGLDFNPHFVMGIQNRGGHARLFDMRTGEIPAADYVVMCSSFYHARGREEEIFAKLMHAARRAVIISEPVHNLSSSSLPLLGRISQRLTNAGDGERHERFDLAGFRQFAEAHGASEIAHRPGQRNAIAVFPKH